MSLEVQQEGAIKTPDKMTDDELRSVLRKAPLIKKWLEAVQDEATSRLQGGAHIAGLELTTTRALDKWAGTPEQVAKVMEAHGMNPGTITSTDPVLISPAKAKKVLGEANYAVLLSSGCIAKGVGKPTVKVTSEAEPEDDFGGLF